MADDSKVLQCAKCGPWVRSSSLTWELARNADSSVLAHEHWIRNMGHGSHSQAPLVILMKLKFENHCLREIKKRSHLHLFAY
jgi:hypothetical protein